VLFIDHSKAGFVLITWQAFVLDAVEIMVAKPVTLYVFCWHKTENAIEILSLTILFTELAYSKE